MLKGLVILGGVALIVAAILVAVYYQQRNAVSKGYDIKCTQPSEPASAPASLVCKIEGSQDADQGHPKPQWWNLLVAWPEGITAWLLLLTLIAIVWQAWETRKSAKATADAASAALQSVKLQEIQFRQWVEIKNWRNITASAYPNVERPTICVRAKIRNTTQYPLVLKEFTIRQGGRTQTSSPNWTMPPKGAYKVPIYADIVAEDGLAEYARGNHAFGVTIDLIFQDAFKKDRSQHFIYWVYCGRDYCRAEMTESHQHQEVIREISSEPTPPN
jgi:hypothetical protein